MPQQRRRRRKVTPDMYRLIAEEHAAGASAPMIVAKLDAGGHPDISERTVLDVIHEQAPTPGEWWTLGASDPGDAPLVFEVMVERARRSNGRRWWIGRLEAEWLVRVRRAKPELPAWDAYRIARHYLRRQQEPGSSTWDLTAELALPADLFEKVMSQYGSFAWGRPLPEELEDGSLGRLEETGDGNS